MVFASALELCAAYDWPQEGYDDLRARLARAGSEELEQMTLGSSVLSRIADLREFRLALLIQHVFDGEIPSEATVSAVFRLTVPQARALLAGLSVRYPGLSRDWIRRAAAAAVKDARADGDGANTYKLAIRQKVVADYLNGALLRHDAGMSSIVRVTGTQATYRLPKSAFLYLAELLGAANNVD